MPRDLVRSTITSYADQRVQVITQRVMATRNLLKIIEDHRLFRDRRESEPPTALVERMRAQIKFELLSANVVDPRSGRPTEANIAFTLSFEYREPQMAQRVLSELVSLYLAENLRARQQGVTETAEFLAKEVAKVKSTVRQLEEKLSAFKQKYPGNLPEDAQINIQRLDRLQRSLSDTTSRIRVHEERRIFLRSELSQVDPQLGAFKRDGVRILTPKEELRARQTELIGLSARYGPRHPDVVRIKREIEALRSEVGSETGEPVLRDSLRIAKADLAELQKKYGHSHPDVVQQRRKVETLEKAAEEKSSKAATSGLKSEEIDNPAYIQLRAQLAATELELGAAKQQRDVLKKEIDLMEERMARSPEVERSYLALQRDHLNATTRLREVRAKLMEAELGKSLEAESKSETLSLIEPASLPIAPVKPNRIAILILGSVFSVGMGIGVGGILEAMDKRIYGARQLARVAGAPPLAAIPDIANPRDTWVKRSWWIVIFLGLGGVLILGAVVVNNFFIPLDVLWFTLERKIGISR